MKSPLPILIALPITALCAPQPQPQPTTPHQKRNPPLPYYMEFHYSKNFVQVGDANLFAGIWQNGYGNSDATGIEADASFNTYGYKLRCIVDDKPDLAVGVKLKGAWGVVAKIPGIQVRNQLVKTMWDMVQKVQEADDVVYKKCHGCSFAGCSDDPKAVCGAFRDEMCDCNLHNGGGGEADFLCFDKSSTYKVPSEMSLTIYNADGSLRADTLEVSITSAEIAKPKSTCGKLGAVLEVVVGIIPEFGKVLADNVKVICRN